MKPRVSINSGKSQESMNSSARASVIESNIGSVTVG